MSRSGLVIWCITVSGGLLLYLRASQILTGGLAVLAVGLALYTADPTEDWEALTKQDSLAVGLVGRTTEEGAFSDRIAFVVNNFVSGILNHPLGEGLGLGQPGGNYWKYGERTGQVGYESEWGRIAFEVGPLGLIGVLGIRLGAGLICWRGLRNTNDQYRRLVIATALPFFGVMALAKMAFNHVGNSFAWLVIALALAAVPTHEPKPQRMNPGGTKRVGP
jgi:hypothetical protein